MDDCETPTNNLQIEPQDGCHPDESLDSIVTRLPSASDENENQLDGDSHGHLTSSDSAMGRPEVFEQDSLNNNENCMPSCEVATSGNSESIPCEDFRDGQTLGKDKKISGKRISRSKRGTTKKMPQGFSSGDATTVIREHVPSEATGTVTEESAKVDANEQPSNDEASSLVLQALFSLIRGEVEQLDSRALPLCLHQIAESYFQEEDYEKAMKFIQLERLYHEQLLANLSAIQEQWETKWKTVQPHTVTSLRNSEKGFNGEDFERLTKFCTTHQDPLLPKHKIAAVEKSLRRKCFTQLVVSEDPKERGATAKESESKICLGMEPSKGQHKEKTLEGGHCDIKMDRQADSQSLPVTAGKDHTEEPPCRAESTLELHAQPSETVWNRSGQQSSENDCEDDNRLLLAQTQDCEDVRKVEDTTEDPKVLISSESVILPGSDHIPLALISEDKYSHSQRKELRLPLQVASEALSTDQLENNELNELQQSDLTDSDGKLPPEQTDSEGSQTVFCENGKTSDLSTVLPEVYMAPEEKGDHDDLISKEAEDYLHNFLEGCLKDAEDSLSYDDNQEEDSDLLQDLSPEEASYSLQENLPADENCLSLDDLAKRIEIAEVAPAEGLVSILKKRNDTVGDQPAQMQQKPSKRRVRFQEIDDNLDQDEIGGGSCILLVLLCIITVFLSVGGTALYCTFGDMESPVCTDFAANVDFYYTKLLQGMAELKHWIYLS
ncbi:consortin isoform X1 [Erinaceus europaeus]|uniref:Consortin isoform X1 n=2 Tax=Erinaceus europaeus TaxID=9365 RepID=A0A1S3AGR6_ERIEU|nr:consortin isoform X1 [Erinaceus europaeus]